MRCGGSTVNPHPSIDHILRNLYAKQIREMGEARKGFADFLAMPKSSKACQCNYRKNGERAHFEHANGVPGHSHESDGGVLLALIEFLFVFHLAAIHASVKTCLGGRSDMCLRLLGCREMIWTVKVLTLGWG